MQLSLVFRVLAGVLVSAVFCLIPAGAYAATHTVNPGENLYNISVKYGVSLGSLMEVNGIKNSLISPGQQLLIPGTKSGSSSASYTVRAGDCLSLIGQKFGVGFQEIIKANGLTNTNIYPGMVLAIPGAFAGAAAQNPVSQVSRGGIFQRPSAADVDLLARLITAEADGEPYAGKVAVGAVVMNRIKSPEFPDTIREVINQFDNGTYQFEPVMNGWINRPASAQSIKAAKDAIRGIDPTNGALYFFATRVDSKWLWSRPLSTIIGKAAFTY
ncbi:MAG: Spore cortex-lytic enzyme precursor [Pelotomaculum sp. PtaB.Bin104]|nr:MAG: Spore cortex-lytic enzyme precursor [Pelotomaculum sp. PtaB.Bin104]